MPTQFFRVHGGRLTIAECWRLARSWKTFLALAGWKLVGGYPFNFPIPRPESLNFVNLDEMPPGRYRDAAQMLVAEFEAAGLKMAFTHRCDPLAGTSLIGCFLDPAGTTIGTFVSTALGHQYEAECMATSHFQDGTGGITSTARKVFKPQPHHLVEYRVRRSPAGLVERHRQNLAIWEREGKFPKSFAPSELPKVILEAQQRHIDFHIARGVFIPMTDAELRAASRAVRA